MEEAMVINRSQSPRALNARQKGWVFAVLAQSETLTDLSRGEAVNCVQESSFWLPGLKKSWRKAQHLKGIWRLELEQWPQICLSTRMCSSEETGLGLPSMWTCASPVQA